MKFQLINIKTSALVGGWSWVVAAEYKEWMSHSSQVEVVPSQAEVVLQWVTKVVIQVPGFSISKPKLSQVKCTLF